MHVVDLRSDTLTMPSEAMRRVMHDAELGDDVFGEDPNVNELERRSAETLGKEAAVLVASGTMGNLLGVLAQAHSGEEVIADADAHLFMFEAAGTATLGGIQVRPLATEAGVMLAEQVEAAVRPLDDSHQPHTAAISIENTHNRHGGVVWPLEDLAAVAGVAERHNLSVHMDGARLFNAAAALGVPVSDIARHADTVSFCLSKGLGCPVGSVVCGPAETIQRARRWRKMLGGGWRKAGMLAAAGIYALDHMVDRLPEDHAHARTLAEGLAEMDGISVELGRVQTNIVYFRLTRMSAREFVSECSARGVRGGAVAGDRVRFVTHYGVEAGDVQRAIEVSAEVLAAS